MLSKSSLSSSTKAKARSLRTVSKAKVFSLFLAVCLAAVSLALIALTAASVDWWNNYYGHGNGPVVLAFQNYSSPGYGYDINNATWKNYLDYKDPGVSLGDTYALLGAGVVGAICAGLVLVLPFWLQESHVFSLARGRRRQTFQRKITLTPRVLTTLLDALLTLFFLAIAVLVWVHYSQSTYASEGIWDLPERPLNRTIHNLAGPDSTFESWNCGLEWKMAYRARKPSQEDIERQCNHATVSRQLIIALLVLALVRLSVWPMSIVMKPVLGPVREFREWRRHTQAMREGKGSELDEVGMRRKRSRDEEEGDPKVGEGRDSVHEVDAEVSPQDFIAELPGCRMSRVEMDEDAARAEMPGAEGGRELDAGVAAVEKDAAVKS